MTELYNLTNMSSSNNFLELTQHANQTTGYMFGNGIIFSLFFIFMVSMRGQPMPVRITGSLLMVTVIAMIFRMIDMVGNNTISILVVLTAGSFMLLYNSRRQ